MRLLRSARNDIKPLGDTLKPPVLLGRTPLNQHLKSLSLGGILRVGDTPKPPVLAKKDLSALPR